MPYTDELVPIPQPDPEAELENQPRDDTEGNDRIAAIRAGYRCADGCTAPRLRFRRTNSDSLWDLQAALA
jgi:hypothetical protein